MTSTLTQPLSDRRRFRARWWIAAAAGAGVLLVIGVFSAVMSVGALSGNTQQVIVGSWNGDMIAMVCVVASAVLFAVIVIAVPAPRWWLLLFVPLRVMGVAAVFLSSFGLLLTDESATPIVADGCDTGYVVSERAFLFGASGEVLRLDGVIGTRVARTTVDDGHKPFQNQSYIAVAEGDAVHVRYTVESVRDPMGASLDLPRLSYQTGCGLAGGEPQAASDTAGPTYEADAGEGPPPSAPHDSRKQVARMAALTVESVVGTPVDATGAPVRVPSAAELPCNGTTGVELIFATDDNEASYAAILGAWTAAGYASDRAMQEDIRYDGTVRLSARDRTTIDGMLHLQLGGACQVP